MNSVFKLAEFDPVVAEANTDVDVELSLLLPTLGSVPTSYTIWPLSVELVYHEKAWQHDSSDKEGVDVRVEGATHDPALPARH